MEKVPVRDVWNHEEYNFTPWLVKNLELLGEALDLHLSLVEQEAWVGNFRLDILAQDENDTMVAIENQLEESDHAHLGKILTYAAGRNAPTLIWITDGFKDEHRTALQWLNRWTWKKIEVYGVEVHAIAIGKSIRVPKFTPVVKPKDWSREPVVEFPSDKQEFFQVLVDNMRHKGFTYTPKGWIQQFDSKSVTGLTYNAGIENAPRVFIDMNDKVMRKRVFGDLRKYKRRMKRMEKELGIEGDGRNKLTWGKGKRNNIGVVREKPQNHPIYPYDELEEIRNWMFEYLIKFEKVFDGEIAEIMDKRGWPR